MLNNEEMSDDESCDDSVKDKDFSPESGLSSVNER